MGRRRIRRAVLSVSASERRELYTGEVGVKQPLGCISASTRPHVDAGRGMLRCKRVHRLGPEEDVFEDEYDSALL
jgi:hypothetical protein